MNRHKRILIHAFLIVFAIWPVVQIALVRIYDANPWKFAGWGMYSAPRIPRGARILCRAPDEIGTYGLSPSIRVTYLDDGDHSFKPRVKSGRTLEQNLNEAINTVAGFVRELGSS